MRLVRGMCFAIAGDTLGRHVFQPAVEIQPAEVSDMPIVWPACAAPLADSLLLSRCTLAVAGCWMFPAQFVIQVLETIGDVDVQPSQSTHVSWIDLLFMLISWQVQFPALCPSTGPWKLAHDLPFRAPHLSFAACSDSQIFVCRRFARDIG